MAGDVGTSQDPGTLIKLHTQLSEVTARAERAEQRLKATEIMAASTAEDLEKAKESLAAKQALVAKLESDQRKQRETLTAEVKKTRAEIDRMKKTSATNPDELEAVTAVYKATQAELTQLNAEKKALNSELRNATDQVRALESKLAATAAQSARQNALAKAAAGNSFADALKKDMTELEPMPMFESAVLQKAFDSQTMKLVEKAAAARRENMRDYALAISQLANKTDPRSYVGLKDYAWALYLKIKDTPPRERSQYRQVLDDTYDAITKKGAKKLKEIRAEYADLFNPAEASRKKIEEKVKAQKASWWESIKHDFWFFRKTVSVSVRSALAEASSPLDRIKTFFSTLWSFWKI